MAYLAMFVIFYVNMIIFKFQFTTHLCILLKKNLDEIF
jgi:hypothetical protein